MTEPQTEQARVSVASSVSRPSGLEVLRSQRKVIVVGLALIVASFWFIGQIGGWTTAALTALGIALALLNHLAGEFWLGRLVAAGADQDGHLSSAPSQGSIAISAITRLAVLTVVAVGLAVWFWPHGIGLLLGLAVFRLVALVMTTLPLLKELKQP